MGSSRSLHRMLWQVYHIPMEDDPTAMVEALEKHMQPLLAPVSSDEEVEALLQENDLVLVAVATP